MTVDEARSTIEQINSKFDDARALLRDLHEREGWRALGYETWRACVVAEFGDSQSRLYRLLTAAQVDHVLSPIGEKGPIRESHARELGRLLESPEALREVYAEVNEQTHGEPTA